MYMLRGGIELARFGPHPRARPGGFEGEIADRERDQIGRDRLVHPEAEAAPVMRDELALLAVEPLAAHHCDEAVGHGDRRRPGLTDAGAILGGDPAAIVDRLALAEEVRDLLAGSELRPIAIAAGYTCSTNIQFPRYPDRQGAGVLAVGRKYLGFLRNGKTPGMVLQAETGS